MEPWLGEFMNGDAEADERIYLPGPVAADWAVQMKSCWPLREDPAQAL